HRNGYTLFLPVWSVSERLEIDEVRFDASAAYHRGINAKAGHLQRDALRPSHHSMFGRAIDGAWRERDCTSNRRYVHDVAAASLDHTAEKTLSDADRAREIDVHQALDLR